ncbi:MAG: Mrp/NBP35 family ATP-binding protein [Candidatus Thermoplasmatota archaeon]|nr:Mrp/NBP35 family ATP-binding protein [Candidatus Thermoplasmatota archaeon]
MPDEDAANEEPLTGPERAKRRAEQAQRDHGDHPAHPGHGQGRPEAVVPSSEAQREQAYRQFQLKLRVQETLDNIGTVLCVMSGKGGVGKSTVAVNLAVALAQQGLETGLADFDLTNPNDHTMLGLRGEHLEAYDEEFVKPKDARENLKVVSTGFLVEDEAPIAWRGPVKTGAIRQFLADIKWGDLDVLVVDLPPGTSDEALSVAQTFPQGTPCLLITSPQETSLENVRQNVRFCEHTGLSVVGIVENFSSMACPHCGDAIEVFPGDAAEELSEVLGAPVLAKVPLDPAVGRSQDKGVPAIEMEPPGPVGDALTALAEHLIQELKLAQKS